ncbi:MAG: hypothetical protein ACKV0T_25225 [Planctomycetales bacterium]
MLKPFAAGLACLGLATLSGAISFGENESEAPQAEPAAVVAQEVIEVAGEAPVADEQTVTGFQFIATPETGLILNNAGALVAESAETPLQDVVIQLQSDGGEGGSAAGPLAGLRRMQIGLLSDAGARDAVSKSVAGLKRKLEELKAVGKMEEAAKTQHSIQALERLLGNATEHGQFIFAGSPIAGTPGQGLKTARIAVSANAAANSKDVHKVVQEIQEKVKRMAAAGTPEERAAIEKELKEVQEKLGANGQIQVMVVGADGNILSIPPGNPSKFTGVMNIQAFPATIANRVVSVPVAGSELVTLQRKIEALSLAAETLKQGGLEDQAREMTVKVEAMKKEAEKLKTQTNQGSAFTALRMHPSHELHGTLVELREQVQQLRKEVGELKELLQKK